MADEEKKNEQPEAAPAEPPKAEPAEAVDVAALAAKAKERDEFLDLAQRTRAELINYRRRIERERAEWTDRAVSEFALKLLPALDDFDRALKEAEGAADVKALLDGFRQIDRKFHEVFKAAGLESFSPHGKPFDAAEHEAVVVEQTDEHPHGTVKHVTRKGWRLRGKVLRPAQVTVAMKPEPKEEPKPEAKGEDAKKKAAGTEKKGAEAPAGKEPKNDADV